VCQFGELLGRKRSVKARPALGSKVKRKTWQRKKLGFEKGKRNKVSPTSFVGTNHTKTVKNRVWCPTGPHQNFKGGVQGVEASVVQ